MFVEKIVVAGIVSLRTRNYQLERGFGGSAGNNVLLIKAQTERTQQANLRAARSRLEVMISAALVKPKHRIATRPGKGARERRLKAKARHAEIKAARRAKPGDF